MPHVFVQPHIPRGSGDAEYRIVDELTGAIVATVDPEMVLDEPDRIADRICALINDLKEPLL